MEKKEKRRGKKRMQARKQGNKEGGWISPSVATQESRTSKEEGKRKNFDDGQFFARWVECVCKE